MIGLETYNFKLNRILLLIIGLWPLQQSNLTRLQFVFMSTFLMTSIMFQLTTFLTSKCTPDFVAKILSSTSFFSLIAINYNLFYLNMKPVKNLLVQLQNICNGLKDENEIAIMKEYSCNAKRFTIVLTMEYFVDQEKYFYLMLIHIIVSLCIGTIVMIAVGTMLLVCFQYTCGLFRICSYRIKHAVHVNSLENIKLKKGNSMLKGIISAVDIHQQAINLCGLLESNIEIMLFCLILNTVITLSLNFFRIFQIVLSRYDIMEIIFPFLFVTVSTIYMFLANYIGQDITDHNNDIFVTVYDVQWHVAPLRIQKMILFLLQRGTKDYIINVGGLFAGSLQNFATLVKSSVSYFTVIYSTQ
ncbi:uncharacterized protein LOC109610554 [Camponotus floridanus]|uniref:uncharacterized protein LOC109610554 n=1 Tax=Camponotus floridanus TaxID=104421 RepID=UPI000DC69C4E|nr:uncharacterized protein LOC109610554 [Camponotus floridanus]